MIKINQLTHVVKSGEADLVVLDDISFEIAQGETIAITGSSGSGKTTLLSMMAGLDTPTSGEVIIDGQAIHAMSEDQRAAFRADNIGVVFQSFHLIPGMTALENVALPLSLKGDKQAHKKASELLEQVGLGKRQTHKPSELSGGEQQRVAIARAFACAPKYLFADEPTGNLDLNTGAHIIDLLFELNAQKHTTLILVTHEQRLADRCGRQLVISNGKLVA